MGKNTKGPVGVISKSGSSVDDPSFDDELVYRIKQIQQRYNKLYCSKVMSDAAFAAVCHAAAITVMSLRKGFELLAKQGMMAFFILAVLYIALSKVSSLSKA